MTDDAEREHARIADEARRRAREGAERAEAEVERIAGEATTGEAETEGLRQSGVIHGALIGVAVVMVQPFLVATSLDASAKVSIVAFAGWVLAPDVGRGGDVPRGGGRRRRGSLDRVWRVESPRGAAPSSG